MRKLIVEEWLSLDGYVSDKDGKLDFFVRTIREIYDDPQRTKFLESIDTILLGRTTYEQFVRTWPQRAEENPLAAKINSAKKIVFSNTLTDAPWGNYSKAEIAQGDPVSKLKLLKTQSGGNMILWGSISLAQHLLKEDLVDELHLHVCPALTAGGRHFFTNALTPLSLHLQDVRNHPSGTVFLNYSI